jgi:S-DNA-T family DNA segregation ATPase FtsK/SpoIIIE
MRLRTFRTPGAGLSPAERAALMGNFAPGAENEEEAEEPEGDETLADEPVYENLDDIADAGPDNDEELPTVELDEPQIMDEAEPYSDEADDTSGKPAGWMSARSAPVPATPRPTPTLARPVYTPPPEPEPVDEEPEPTLAPLASAPEWVVPNFRQVLDPVTEQNINDDVLLDRARIIEDTLISFGAPGKVVEVNPGPVITQFGIEPDYVESRGGKRTRVKVQAIARLADDLALSLAARSIRIEAPVPGKGFVGIEVPNAETSLVSLRDIMESPEFARLDTKLRIGLGQSVDGTPVVADLTAMPHLLIAGTTGSGKSVCVNAIIACLLLQNTPDDLRMIMVDPKRVELTGYNGIPHLVAPVVVELERIVGVLKWVTREMDDRYKRFNERGARNILTYNNMLLPGEKPLPYLIVIVDELADLMMLAPDETERVLTRLAQMSRATGIHLIISTQRPSVDVVTGLIKANFPARVAFAVASSVDSRVILDQPGAERLLGRGDMLFQAPDAAAPVRLQGVYVSDSELTRLVSHWKGIRPLDENPHPTSRLESNMVGSSPTASRSVGPVRSRTEKYGLPTARSSASSSFWERVTPGKEERTRTSSDDVDELYDESVAVVRRMKKASVSLLQRQLRIGYTRAARLIDVMEERGVVGPAQSGSKPRKVIGYSDDDIDLGADEEEDTMDDIRDDEFSDDFEEDEEIFDDDAYEDEEEDFADDE